MQCQLSKHKHDEFGKWRIRISIEKLGVVPSGYSDAITRALYIQLDFCPRFSQCNGKVEYNIIRLYSSNKLQN